MNLVPFRFFLSEFLLSLSPVLLGIFEYESPFGVAVERLEHCSAVYLGLRVVNGRPRASELAPLDLTRLVFILVYDAVPPLSVEFLVCRFRVVYRTMLSSPLENWYVIFVLRPVLFLHLP